MSPALVAGPESTALRIPKSQRSPLLGTNLLRFAQLTSHGGGEELCYFCILAKLQRELALKGELGEGRKKQEEAVVELEARRHFLQDVLRSRTITRRPQSRLGMWDSFFPRLSNKGRRFASRTKEIFFSFVLEVDAATL